MAAGVDAVARRIQASICRPVPKAGRCGFFGQCGADGKAHPTTDWAGFMSHTRRLQIANGRLYGYIKDFPIERYLRDIVGGCTRFPEKAPNEIMRVIHRPATCAASEEVTAGQDISGG